MTHGGACRARQVEFWLRWTVCLCPRLYYCPADNGVDELPSRSIMDGVVSCAVLHNVMLGRSNCSESRSKVLRAQVTLSEQSPPSRVMSSAWQNQEDVSLLLRIATSVPTPRRAVMRGNWPERDGGMLCVVRRGLENCDVRPTRPSSPLATGCGWLASLSRNDASIQRKTRGRWAGERTWTNRVTAADPNYADLRPCERWPVGS